VNEEHRDYLRSLWWEKGDTSKEPKEYRMTVHLFGAISSPACANLALKTTDDNETELGSELGQFLRRNVYVDDGLKSVSKPEDSITLIQRSQEMCRRGGFINSLLTQSQTLNRYQKRPGKHAKEHRLRRKPSSLRKGTWSRMVY